MERLSLYNIFFLIDDNEANVYYFGVGGHVCPGSVHSLDKGRTKGK